MAQRGGGAIRGPFYIDASEVHTYAARLDVAAKRTPAQTRKKVRHWTALLLTQVKRNANLPASGPPGPRKITGDYLRTITKEFFQSAHSSTGIVGTNAVQGRRLEMGFFGVDSLGRVYHQPAYAHFRPAADDIEPRFVADLSTDVGSDL